ncbi:integrase, partial [Mesorhizobium sp. B2-7-1]
LFPTENHTFYSLRHSFEDRMKNARLDEELRRMLMGHTIDRPKYGEGGEMKMWQEELMKIALPFDPDIV